MTSPLDWIREAAATRAEAGLTRRLTTTKSGEGLDLAGNDYLGLRTHPAVVAGAVAAAETYGTGAGASRLVTGTLDVHDELEQALVSLTSAPAALVLSSGYAANLAALSTLADAGTLVVSDEHAHASLIDGCRLSRAAVSVARHNDLEHYAELLSRRDVPRAVVVAESIYSVLGDAAPLRALVDVCHRHGALLVVDEAHGIGVAGHGRGLVHELDLVGSRDLVVTLTLSKALGSQGGAVLGSTAVRNHLVNTARSFIFDTGLAPASAAAACAAADIVASDATLAAAVRANARTIAAICGIEPAAGAVQSLPMSSPESAVAAALDLRAQGVLVGCFRPPSVPDGVSRLRVTARADLSGDDLYEAARLVARAAAIHGGAPDPATVEGPRAGDAPSPVRGLPSVAAVEGVQPPAPPSPLGSIPPHGDDD